MTVNYKGKGTGFLFLFCCTFSIKTWKIYGILANSKLKKAQKVEVKILESFYLLNISYML